MTLIKLCQWIPTEEYIRVFNYLGDSLLGIITNMMIIIFIIIIMLEKVWRIEDHYIL